MSWDIFISEEYEVWLAGLSEKDQASVVVDLEVLRNFGPMLGRPHVDRVKGSQFPNMKELRTKTASHVYRSLFAFDPERRGIVLIGGDKKGKDQKKFYQRLIAQADKIFDQHLQKMSRK